MTLERQKYLEPFIIAQNKGETVQYKSSDYGDIWFDIHDSFVATLGNLEHLEFRIKSEPREYYVMPPDGCMSFPKIFKTLDDAKTAYQKQYHHEIIKVREVIE